MVVTHDGVLCHACGERTERSATHCLACHEALLLSDRYLLERVLGSNVGTTYLATDTRGDRQVVIKELSYSKLDAWKSEDLFQREIRVLRRLDHPQVPAYIDDFSCGQGKRLAHYLVQEHLAGESLREELDHRRHDEEQVLGIVDQVLEVLEYLQGLRPPLIHRDLKPSNLIRLEGTDKIALIDFGAVRDLVAPTGENPTVAGTFGFMAPEQFQGEAFLQTDLYALGVVALNLLTRIQPQKMLSSSTQLAWQEHVRVSPPMERLLEALLAPKVGDRPEDARAARALLAEVRREQQTSEPAKGFVRIPTPTATQSPARFRVLWVVVVCALAVGGLTALLLARNRAAPQGAAANTTPRAVLQRPASTPKESTGLAAAKLMGILSAYRWKGNIDGKLDFHGAPGQIAAKFTHRDGRQVMVSAQTSPAGTITMVLHWQDGGTTTVTTFTGRLTADHKTLAGSYDRVQRSGEQRSESSGKWYVRAVARIPPPSKYPHTVAALFSGHVDLANRKLVPLVRACYRKHGAIRGSTMVIRRDGKPGWIGVGGPVSSNKAMKSCLRRAIVKARFPKIRSKEKSFPYPLPL